MLDKVEKNRIGKIVGARQIYEKKPLEYCFDKFLNAAMHIEVICNWSDKGYIARFPRIYALLDQCAGID